MKKTILKFNPDFEEKYLDKQREIDGYTVDAFRLVSLKNHTAEIILLKWNDNRTFTKVILKNKRVSFTDGKAIIILYGFKYCIGTYDIVEN